MNLNKITYFLFFFLFTISRVDCQQSAMLESVLEFTSKDEFIANTIFKVVGQNFSKDGSIKVEVEGDITSPEFSIVLLSVLPALQKIDINKKLVLKYSNYNESNLEEALIIESIRHLYPNSLYEYLISRSVCSFEESWNCAVNDMDTKLLSQYIKNDNFIEKVKSMFFQDLENESKLKFVINDIDFFLIKEFFIGVKGLLASEFLPENGPCDFMYCISHTLNQGIRAKFKAGVIWPVDVGEFELIYDQQEIYTAIIVSLALDNGFIASIKKILFEPVDLLENSLRTIDYKILAGNVASGFFKYDLNHCKKRSCFYFNKK